MQSNKEQTPVPSRTGKPKRIANLETARAVHSTKVQTGLRPSLSRPHNTRCSCIGYGRNSTYLIYKDPARDSGSLVGLSDFFNSSICA